MNEENKIIYASDFHGKYSKVKIILKCAWNMCETKKHILENTLFQFLYGIFVIHYSELKLN